jgi:5-methylcytosine-specific restriction endonuclease McrA
LIEKAICKKCRLEKPVSEFSKESRKRSGIRNECKSCYAAYAREWARKNSDVVNARVRAYHQKNKDELNLKRAIRAQRNPAQTKQSRRRWAENNPEKMRASRIKALQKRRLLEKSSTYQIPVKAIMKLQKNACFYCGAKENIEIDHIVPISKGGRNSEGNLISACVACNRSKGAKFLMEWKLKRKKMEAIES